MSFYIHNIPGRLRLRSALIKKNPEVAKNVKEILETIKGVEVLDLNVLTGSILIKYDTETTKPEDIILLLERNGYFNISMATTNDDYIYSAVQKAGKAFFRAIVGAIIGPSVEGTPLSLLTVLI